MALQTIDVAQAGDGALIVSSTFDDVTGLLSSVKGTITRGTGTIRCAGITTALAGSQTKNLLLPGNTSRLLNGISLEWGP
jgi:hypothetical protein